MAKRETEPQGQAQTAGEKIEEFAEDLGRIIGTARAKAESWLGQRKQITETLVSIRDESSRLLRELGHEVEEVLKRGRPRKAARAEGESQTEAAPQRSRRKPGRRGWSKAQRAAAAERMKKYWATRRKKA